MNIKVMLAGAAATICMAQTERPPQRIEIRLERKAGDGVRQVAPGFVCQNGDLLRFRFKVSFDGYLYVIDEATSGRFTQLFPKPETGMDNRVERGREYVLPANDTGWFRVDPPAGHEQVYWVLSPTRLPELRPQATEAPQPPIQMTPRCDDTLFRARGDCIDHSAGAHPIRNPGDLPAPLAGLRPRELSLITSGNTTSVIAQEFGDGPLIYVFRLAHR